MSPCILSTNSTQTNGRRGNAFPFPIEIRHYDFKTSVLFVQQVVERYNDVFEDDECASRGSNAGVVHLASCHTWRIQGYDEKGYPRSTWATSPHCRRNVIRPDCVCDPLLRAIDDVMIALSFGGSLDVGYIGTGCSN
jgi:hypothetical protein